MTSERESRRLSQRERIRAGGWLGLDPAAIPKAHALAAARAKTKLVRGAGRSRLLNPARRSPRPHGRSSVRYRPANR